MPDEIAEREQRPHFAGLLGIEWLDDDHAHAHARVAVRDELLQPFGIVHGGVMSTLGKRSYRRSGGRPRGGSSVTPTISRSWCTARVRTPKRYAKTSHMHWRPWDYGCHRPRPGWCT